MSFVRRATIADAAAFEGLRLAWAAEKGVATNDSSFSTRFATWMASEGDKRLFWIAEIDELPVAMVTMSVFTRMPYPETADFSAAWGYLGNLFVLPEHRGHGVGRALVEACTAHAADNGFARVVLSPSAASVPLYERAGFRPADELMVWRP